MTNFQYTECSVRSVVCEQWGYYVYKTWNFIDIPSIDRNIKILKIYFNFCYMYIKFSFIIILLSFFSLFIIKERY